jgi:hypothetical protein
MQRNGSPSRRGRFGAFGDLLYDQASNDLASDAVSMASARHTSSNVSHYEKQRNSFTKVPLKASYKHRDQYNINGDPHPMLPCIL